MSYLSHLTWQQGGMALALAGLAILAVIVVTLVTDVARGRPLPSQAEVEDAIRRVSSD